ncbi:5'-3' exonuclease N-terminus [Carpediemonas membranifera]|uniref:5'-3' exonuclease N-terminus n=1 Tax=Carpediemonas membranifera TaxID=201153 RepID=A0A8J6DZ02_9EUKA|nr:5'-3' exonuclease N-terminus [Carpediemonas membranifera]|eukprot:KAG9390053.1 5'-3' exonuclease N-terminus [Carpediemonas membranifera]
MGVPKFYRWLCNRYPEIVSDFEEYSPNLMDNLYLDLNGIIHNCTHPSSALVCTLSEHEVFSAIFASIDHFFKTVQPRKRFFIAVDGSAPRAKLNQQRQRRFKAASDIRKSLDALINKGILTGAEVADLMPDYTRTGDPMKDHIFDSNCITPGTAFMQRLHAHLEMYLATKVSSDPLYSGVDIYYSGYNCPGEGEHKIMDFIRSIQRQNPGYKGSERHMLYSADADLIMLALALNEPDFFILRDKPRFSKSQREHELAVLKDSAPLKLPDSYPHQVLSVRTLLDCWTLEHKEALEQRARALGVPFRWDPAAIAADFVLLTMFLGNDFLPHLPGLDIHEHAVDVFLDQYVRTLPELGGYLTELTGFDQKDGTSPSKFNLPRTLTFVARVAAVLESPMYLEKRPKVQSYLASKGFDPITAPEDLDLIPQSHDPADIEAALQSLQLEGDETATMEAQARVSAELKAWYYGTKFKGMRPALPADTTVTHPAVTTSDAAEEEETISFHRSLHTEYVKAIYWVMGYYFDGCPSWAWYYPFFYGPMASDLSQTLGYMTGASVEFNLAAPYRPFEQLLAVLPRLSAHCLPRAFDAVISDKASPIYSLYDDTHVDLDMEFAKYEWQAVVLVPFLNESLMLDAVTQLVDGSTINTRELDRNLVGPTQLLRSGQHQQPLHFIPLEYLRLPPKVNVQFNDMAGHTVEDTVFRREVAGVFVHVAPTSYPFFDMHPITSWPAPVVQVMPGFPTKALAWPVAPRPIQVPPAPASIDSIFAPFSRVVTSLESVNVAVFQHASHNASFVTSLETATGAHLQAIQSGQVYAGWPVIRPAKLVALATPAGKIIHSDPSDPEARQFTVSAAATGKLQKQLLSTLAVRVVPAALALVRMFVEHSSNARGQAVALYGPAVTVPAEMVIPEAKLTPAATRSFRSASEEMRVGFVLVTEGEMKGHIGVPTPDGRLRVTSSPPGAAEFAVQTDRWLRLGQAARQLSLDPGALGRLLTQAKFMNKRRPVFVGLGVRNPSNHSVAPGLVDDSQGVSVSATFMEQMAKLKARCPLLFKVFASITGAAEDFDLERTAQLVNKRFPSTAATEAGSETTDPVYSKADLKADTLPEPAVVTAASLWEYLNFVDAFLRTSNSPFPPRYTVCGGEGVEAIPGPQLDLYRAPKLSGPTAPIVIDMPGSYHFVTHPPVAVPEHQRVTAVGQRVMYAGSSGPVGLGVGGTVVLIDHTKGTAGVIWDVPPLTGVTLAGRLSAPVGTVVSLELLYRHTAPNTAPGQRAPRQHFQAPQRPNKPEVTYRPAKSVSEEANPWTGKGRASRDLKPRVIEPSKRTEPATTAASGRDTRRDRGRGKGKSREPLAKPAQAQQGVAPPRAEKTDKAAAQPRRWNRPAPRRTDGDLGLGLLPHLAGDSKPAEPFPVIPKEKKTTPKMSRKQARGRGMMAGVDEDGLV